MIREIEPADLTAVISLIREFAEYEGLTGYCTVTEPRLAEVLFGDGSFVEGLVAETDGRVVGYALYYPCFASFRGQAGLYLEDIYVTDEFRRGGTGLLLIKEIARRAASRGFERIDFQVLKWNEPALAFYRKHGAESNDEETHFRFAGEAFRALAS